jgi:hypothetical protein
MDFRKAIAPAAIGLAVLVVAAGLGYGLKRLDTPKLFTNPHKPGTPAYVAFEAYQKDMAGNGAFVELMRAAPDQQAAMQRGAELTQKGMLRLPDSALISRLDLMLGLMKVGDEKQCAALAEGAPLDGNLSEFAGVMFALLDRADADLVTRWYDFTREATLAELEQRPATPSAEGAQEDLGRLLMDKLSPEQVEILVAMAQQRSFGISDAELCDVGKGVVELILAQPEAERGRYARLMATP